MHNQHKNTHLTGLTHLTVFKGGTAFNSLLQDFQTHFPHVSYVVPITDDGGSSREISRVFGGPSIGDLRSTLTRLSDDNTPETRAVKRLLEHRLPKNHQNDALHEWHMLLEDTHPLYTSISSRYKELIRCFLSKFETERLHRISDRFDMRNGSIGNFFFSGARMVLGSLETAIFMYSNVAKISSNTRVFPITDSNEQLGIGVNLEDGSTMIGQHMISHPSSQGCVEKRSFVPLSASIKELFYVDKFKNRINPQPHPEVIESLKISSGIIYGMGSLWTSIIPSLVLAGVGETIASLDIPKISLLNCCNDRETSGMSAADYVTHLTNSLNRYGALSHPPRAYITDLCVVEGAAIPVDNKQMRALGIQVHLIPKDSYDTLQVQDEAYPVYASHELTRAINKIMG